MEEKKQEILKRVEKLLDEIQDLGLDIWELGYKEDKENYKYAERSADFAFDELVNIKHQLENV